MKTQHKLFGFLLLPGLLVGYTSCKKFLEMDPPKSKILSERVFNSDVTANAAVIAMYATLAGPQSFAGGDQSGVTMLAGLSSDELVNRKLNSIVPAEFNANNLSVENNGVLLLWTSAYKVIYMANAAIEGLAASSGVSASLKTRLEGEALFVRAFCHFYLVNMFGDVPLVITTDYQSNATVTRTPKEEVYKQVVADLQKAKTQLGDAYADNERIRPNKGAAQALLARAYLYTGKWADAESEAGAVISNTAWYRLTLLDSVFLKNSDEAIWQLNNVSTGTIGYTSEAYYFNPPYVLSNNALSPAVVDAFETGDNRRNKWVGTYTTGGTVYYPYKYKQTSYTTVTEYSMQLRLGEQYLIRAEARAKQDNTGGAQSDINAIRNRAMLGNTTANNQATLLAAIEQERRIELFSESGHRWFDLKRTNRANAVLAPVKAGWNPQDTLYPIPQKELSNNPKLYPQNAGY